MTGRAVPVHGGLRKLSRSAFIFILIINVGERGGFYLGKIEAEQCSSRYGTHW